MDENDNQFIQVERRKKKSKTGFITHIILLPVHHLHHLVPQHRPLPLVRMDNRRLQTPTVSYQTKTQQMIIMFIPPN